LMMMRHILIFCLVATTVQGLKLNYGEEVAVCTLGSTLSTDARLHKALDKCGFYTMKESDYMEEEDEEDNSRKKRAYADYSRLGCSRPATLTT